MKFRKLACAFLICVLSGVGLVLYGCGNGPTASEGGNSPETVVPGPSEPGGGSDSEITDPINPEEPEVNPETPETPDSNGSNPADNNDGNDTTINPENPNPDPDNTQNPDASVATEQALRDAADLVKTTMDESGMVIADTYHEVVEIGSFTIRVSVYDVLDVDMVQEAIRALHFDGLVVTITVTAEAFIVSITAA